MQKIFDLFQSNNSYRIQCTSWRIRYEVKHDVHFRCARLIAEIYNMSNNTVAIHKVVDK